MEHVIEAHRHRLAIPISSDRDKFIWRLGSLFAAPCPMMTTELYSQIVVCLLDKEALIKELRSRLPELRSCNPLFESSCEVVLMQGFAMYGD